MDQISADECVSLGEGEEELLSSRKRRVIEKCLDCPRFARDLQTLRGSDNPLAGILPFLMAELADQKAQLQFMGGFLDAKIREIAFLHELSVELQTSLNLDEVLSVAMTAITAGKGFGMNRAFLLMTDKERQYLRGYLGVGPLNAEEAWHIWEEVGQSNLSLKEMAKHFKTSKLSSEKVKFHDILEKLTVPLKLQDHIFNRSLRERRPILVENAFSNPDVDRSVAETLGVDSFLIMPLISGNRRIGLIIADNCITHRPITTQDMQSMETFAFPVSFALVRASLYERLQEELQKVTEANLKLKEQQETIVRMEKMALVGRITSSIAHSIRNPLMIIGGFTRSLLKDVPENDPKRPSLESIVATAKQLENVLDEVLSYSDSLYPARDMWDVNQLVAATCGELQEQLEKRGVTCTMNLAPGLPPVYVDYRQVSYCLRGVITTVADRLADNGELIIATSRDDASVALRVLDPTTSLTREEREALTTPFSATQELGIGLTMPLCKTILERASIPFDINSPPEGGTTYTLNLPITKEEEIHGQDSRS
ncbi:MAG TPA: GAF domain-containing sensor histidine kinase [Geobacteraceae bacterium]